MPYLDSVKDGTLFDVFKQYPHFSYSLHIFLQDLLRGDDSPFSIAERELIAGYVSGLNQCGFCCSVHAGLAEQLGGWNGLVETFISDGAGFVPENEALVPVFEYVAKLNSASYEIGQNDIDKVIEAGWSEDAVVHANLICGVFNLFNRWVSGLGVTADKKYVDMTIKKLLADEYVGVNDMIARIVGSTAKKTGT